MREHTLYLAYENQFAHICYYVNFYIFPLFPTGMNFDIKYNIQYPEIKST